MQTGNPANVAGTDYNPELMQVQRLGGALASTTRSGTGSGAGTESDSGSSGNGNGSGSGKKRSGPRRVPIAVSATLQPDEIAAQSTTSTTAILRSELQVLKAKMSSLDAQVGHLADVARPLQQRSAATLRNLAEPEE